MNDGARPNPDALLAAIQSEAAQSKRGRLKVFLGMCPGIGKTYAMLEAAQREFKAKRDVVIGYVETHGRKETDALVVGLPMVPRKSIEHRGLALAEMDLDAVLARHPQLALVDELAHTNAPGSRHPKRWQDVAELREAGIDVFTTVNVQHIESRADTVRQITGAEIRENVPDSVLDDAEIELVDLPTDELLRRLQEGKVYLPERAAAAAKNFFREANLTALRELALRLVADHVGEETTQFHRAHGTGAWKTGNRLLVAVSASPLSESLIRWTRRTADSLRCEWLAVHVEGSHPLDEEPQARLEKNLTLARKLGAEVIATADDDLVHGLLRIAHQHNVTQIVVGKPSAANLFEWFRAGKLLRRLTRESGNIDLHVVRAEKDESARPISRRRWMPQSNWKQYALAIGAVVAIGLFNALLIQFTGPRVPGLVFLLGVVLLALVLGRGPVFLAGASSALVWNFFFLSPRFQFTISGAEDAILFGLYFVVAIVLGQLVARIRTQEQAERLREERAIALYQLTREFAQAGTRDEVVWQLLAEANRVFNAPIAVILPDNRNKLAAHPDSSLILSEKELNVAEWAFHHRQSAGRFTDNLPGAEALHLPLVTEHAVMGVLSVGLPEKTLTLAQRDLLEAFARQAALVLDRVALRATAEQSKLIAESERLSNALLNSISHELRTPLAAITSATATLAEAKDAPMDLRSSMIAEIQEAASRLNRLVGNLLDVTRLASGHVQPKLDWCDVGDLIQATVRLLRRELAGRPLKVQVAEKLPFAKLDFTLMQQALSNLLLNAVVHTPPGTEILIQARQEQGALVLSVADSGSGLSPELLPRIFDKFVRGAEVAAGGSGLGLAIGKGFVEAHGGQISAANRPGGGAIFTIRLPEKEPPPTIETKP